MANAHVVQRLTGIHGILNGVHQAGGTLSSATKGSERETFIDRFLADVFPPPFRFGTGDATDAKGKRSGQLDVVMEYPFLPSLPLPTANARLYLAESIAAVVEVKSNIANQIGEAVQTADQLAPLHRDFGTTMSIGAAPLPRIPIFAVGYTGWKTVDTVKTHVDNNPNLDGILVIDAGIFVASDTFYGITGTGPISLWGLICCLHQAASTLKSTSAHPITYGQEAT